MERAIHCIPFSVWQVLDLKKKDPLKVCVHLLLGIILNKLHNLRPLESPHPLYSLPGDSYKLLI